MAISEIGKGRICRSVYEILLPGAVLIFNFNLCVEYLISDAAAAEPVLRRTLFKLSAHTPSTTEIFLPPI